jgi:hypothetical protein
MTIAPSSRARNGKEIRVWIDAAVAERAERDGLLESAALESILRRESAGRELERIHAAMDNLPADEFPPMTMDEIVAEVKAARAELRAKRAPGS